jgi:uncharacterized protein (TIGR02118 family)
MFKMLIFLKRKPGMSREAFREYYENVHVKIALKHPGQMKRYMRRYVRPLPNPLTGEVEEMDFDVVTECWFDSKEAFAASLMPDDIRAEIAADEENVFDRSKIRYVTVSEAETDLSGS